MASDLRKRVVTPEVTTGVTTPETHRVGGQKPISRSGCYSQPHDDLDLPGKPMSSGQQQKSAYYQALKDLEVPFSKPYREYTVDELKEAYELCVSKAGENGVVMPSVPLALTQPPAGPAPTAAPASTPPVAPKAPELPGQRLNTESALQPIRTDPETGFIWFQEEVLKPTGAKPRGRRVLTEMHGETEVVTVQQGQFMETFETEGQGTKRQTTTKITLPSYQVGIYKDPRYPFKIHVYNEQRGFDLFEVDAYYGGRELVPAECKRMYVENVLCYDMRTVIRAIQTEFRHHQLTGKI